jgi:lipoprotein-releasing system ATP-binding protein
MSEPRSPAAPILEAIGLHKVYTRNGPVPVLRGVDLAIYAGEFVTVIGSSGCGKSTLLHLLGMLDTPSEGEVRHHGQRLDNRPTAERDRYRNESTGFIFQSYHLLPELTALENVMLPQMIRRGLLSWFGGRRAIETRATDLLKRVGLGHRLHHRPKELSGGEMQRAAIARSLLAGPEILLADEPTGNLDPETGESILQLLIDLRQEIGLTVVMVTHNHDVARRSDRTLKLDRGQLVGESGSPGRFRIVSESA